MRRFVPLLALASTLLAAACLATPPPELLVTRTPQPSATPGDPASEALDPRPTTTSVEIGGRTVSVDEVIHGFLCDDEWDGTIYVAGDIQVSPWVDEPSFLRECNLVVSPGTIVHVASHPGEVFYRGCTCHE